MGISDVIVGAEVKVNPTHPETDLHVMLESMKAESRATLGTRHEGYGDIIGHFTNGVVVVKHRYGSDSICLYFPDELTYGFLEVEAAAGWWADKLAEGRPSANLNKADPGTQNLVVGHAFGVALTKKDIPPEQVKVFRESLIEILQQYVLAEGWKPDNPKWGLRYVANEYGPDRHLEAALNAAGIRPTSFLFPWKTIMWINPGSVVVREGEVSEQTVVWPQSGKA